MRVILAVAVLGGLIAGGARAEGCKLAPMAKLPVQDTGTRLMVQALFNGQPANMIFDSGMYTTAVTQSTAARVDLRVAGGEEADHNTRAMTGVIGVGGSRSTIEMTARTMELGGIKARNFDILAADLVSTPADGLLSIDLIANYDVDLDLPEQRINLFRALGDCSHPAALLEGPLLGVALLPTGQDRRPRIVVQIGGQDVVALVDTGAYHTAIFRSAAARLGLNPAAALAASKMRVTGVGPEKVAAASVIVPELDVGDLVFKNTNVDVIDGNANDQQEMLLGADFLHKVHFWISYSSHTLIMQFPPKATKPTQ